MPEFYHQLGGKGSTLQDWIARNTYDYKAIAQDLLSTTRGAPLEMVLGIKASGASYLLFPESKAAGIARTLYYRPPLSNKVISAEAFESLSPVVFPDATKLDKKLSALAPKAAKRGRDDHDNSQANKPYMNSTTDGANRAMFEHNRVLYRILHNQLSDCRDFGLRVSQEARMKELRLVSLVFTQWIGAPNTILDIGYSVGEVPTSTHHLALNRNAKLDKHKRADFKHGSTEWLDQSAIDAKLKSLFACSKPTVLLVWNEEKTRDMLARSDLGASGWHTGLQKLFYYSSSQADRAKPLPGQLQYGQVYIVDVQKLCQSLFQTPHDTQTVRQAGRSHLKIPMTRPEEVEKECAGNDARMIFDIWRSLAEGNAIDEQREERKGNTSVVVPAASIPAPEAPPIPVPSGGGDDDDEDDEADPNDAPVIKQQATVSVPEDDDQSDYGLDEDDSEY